MRRLLFLLILLSTFYFLSSIAVAQTDDERIAELQNEIERLEQQAKLYRQNIASEHSKADSLNKEISILQNQINNLKTQINITARKIDGTLLEINNVTNEISVTQGRIEYQKSAIGELLLEVYKQDRESLFVAVMKNANISDFLNRIQQTANVGESLLTLVGDLRDTKDAYENQKSALEGKKKEFENLNYKRVTEIVFGRYSKRKRQLTQDNKRQRSGI